MNPLIIQIVGGVTVLVFVIIFGIIAYFIKRYIDNQDIAIKELRTQNDTLVKKMDDDTKTLKNFLEQRITTEYQQTNRALVKEKEILLKEIQERDNYIEQRVERRVRHTDCICQSEEVKARFDSGDRLFEKIKKCLDTLSDQVGNGLDGIHQYSLIMSSTMLALCQNFGEDVNCKELEALHKLLQERKIQNIVDKVDK